MQSKMAPKLRATTGWRPRSIAGVSFIVLLVTVAFWPQFNTASTLGQLHLSSCLSSRLASPPASRAHLAHRHVMSTMHHAPRCACPTGSRRLPLATHFCHVRHPTRPCGRVCGGYHRQNPHRHHPVCKPRLFSALLLVAEPEPSVRVAGGDRVRSVQQKP